VLPTEAPPFLLETDSAAVLAGQRPFRVASTVEKAFVALPVSMIAGLLVWLVKVIALARGGATDTIGAAAGVSCPSVLLFIALLSLFQGLATFRRRARLAERRSYLRGRVVRGRAEAARGRWWLSIDYEFTTPDGQPMKNSAAAEREDLRGQPPPEPGTPVLIAFRDHATFVLM
jgi:hypothetical protein